MSNTRRIPRPEPEKVTPVAPPSDEAFLRQAAVEQEAELLNQLRNTRAMILKANYLIGSLIAQLKEAGIEPNIKMTDSQPEVMSG